MVAAMFIETRVIIV